MRCARLCNYHIFPINHDFLSAPKVNEATSRAWWSEWSCSNVQAHYRALDDYIPLWSLWQGTPVKLRGMRMQQEWFSKRETETLRELSQIIKSESVRNNSERKLNSDVKKYSRNGYTAENTFVVGDITRTHLCDNVNIHSQKIDEREVPGSVVYDRKAKEIKVRCRDGWVTFQHVMLKGRKLMTAQEFYNGFMSKVSIDLQKFT